MVKRRRPTADVPFETAAAGAAALGEEVVVLDVTTGVGGADGAGGGGSGGHTTHGAGGHSKHGTGEVATCGVQAVTTVQGHPAVPAVHATPADVKHAGAAHWLLMVATQYVVPEPAQLTCAMFCSWGLLLPTDGIVTLVPLGNTELQVPYAGDGEAEVVGEPTV
jgi:hypothetical protein